MVKSIVEKSPNALSVFTRACEVPQLRDREVRVLDADAVRALADVDQPILVAVDERPQQHAPDDAEDGGVGADAERQREDDGEGEALGPGERAERELEVGDQVHRGLLQSCYPPASAPMTRNGSAPLATGSGSSASGGSSERSCSHAKNRRNARRFSVP